jgi:hypothetical protein
MYRVKDYKFSDQPFEGHVSVTLNVQTENLKETFYPGSVKIDMNQPKSDLVMHLLEPQSPDSFLQWGYFAEIFNRTEYIETYALEPLAQQMLKKDPKLKEEFEKKKTADPEFVKKPNEVYRWFYQRSPYFDSRWLLYPVGVQY